MVEQKVKNVKGDNEECVDGEDLALPGLKLHYQTVIIKNNLVLFKK